MYIPKRIPKEPGLYFTIEALGPVAIVLTRFLKPREIEEIFQQFEIRMPLLGPMNDVNFIQEKFLFLITTGEMQKLQRLLEKFTNLAAQKNESWKDDFIRVMNESLARCFVRLRYHLPHNVYQLAPFEYYELAVLRDRATFRRKLEKKGPISKRRKKSKEEMKTSELKSRFLNNDARVQLNAVIEIDGLATYNDGSIRYKKDIIDLRPQLKELCRFFMQQPKKLITLNDIMDKIIDAPKRENTPYATISKYVSELHGALKIHFKKDVIFNSNRDGWYLDTTKNIKN